MLRLPSLPSLPRAACRGKDPNLFMPRRGESAGPAKAICRGCPELDACRAFALAASTQLKGVWGGLSQYDRVAIRRPNRRKQKGIRMNGSTPVTTVTANAAHG